MSAVPDPSHHPDHTLTPPRHSGESRHPVDAAWLLAQYERIADAPDAVARLRRFVLDLAVRGKLVEQNPKDAAASELLQKIDDERKRQGLKSIPSPIKSDEAPFVLPNQWEWSRIGDICTKTGSGSTPRGGKSAYKTEGVPFLRSQNVYNDGLRLDDVALIDSEIHDRMSGTKVRPNDLLLNITGGSIGRCCHVTNSVREANISQHVAIIRAAAPEMAVFLHWFVLSPYFQSHVLDRQTGAGRGGLPKNRMDKIVVALPPLAEQHRIVAKVDELMALCDRLEAARTRRAATRDQLATASLRRLTAPDTDTDATTFRDHARFALDHLPALTARANQIKALRQTILDLAVRGKLVTQDPTEEPAEELLTRIVKEKARMKEAGVLRRLDKAKDLAGTPPPFPLPVGWKWTQISQLGIISPRNTAEDKTPASFVPMTMIRSKYGVRHNHEVREWESIKKGYTHFAEGDVGLAKITPCFENGKSTVFRNLEGGIGAGTTELHIVRPLLTNPDYIALFLKSWHFIRTGIGKMTGTAGQKRVPKDYFAHSPFPLPPLPEQHRIVAKVDQLMALCDQLEASLAKAETTRSRLLEATLREALQSPARDTETV